MFSRWMCVSEWESECVHRRNTPSTINAKFITGTYNASRRDGSQKTKQHYSNNKLTTHPLRNYWGAECQDTQTIHTAKLFSLPVLPQERAENANIRKKCGPNKSNEQYGIYHSKRKFAKKSVSKWPFHLLARWKMHILQGMGVSRPWGSGGGG